MSISINNDTPYNNLSTYLRERYGRRLKKICIDGGFTCPNRDGRCGTGGCIYCGERGAGEHIDLVGSVYEQASAALSVAGKDDIFIAYFQNFTGTYAPVSSLKEKYDAALIDERVKILAIGTRPDCIDESVAALIASYRERVDIWVELGLQTSSDATAELINRGYKIEVFLRACEILHKFNIPFVVHIMIGLPRESREDVINTVRLVNSVNPFGVKIHSVYVMRDTGLAQMYENGEYTPLGMQEYVALAAESIARLSPDIVMHRITGDCPRDLLVAPAWNADKSRVVSEIQAYLLAHGLRQGSLV